MFNINTREYCIQHRISIKIKLDKIAFDFIKKTKNPIQITENLTCVPSQPFQLVKLETTGNETELLAERLRQTEKELNNVKKEGINYQNMLQQSQHQFTTLDRKYNKAKRLVREYQQREVDMVRVHTYSCFKYFSF